MTKSFAAASQHKRTALPPQRVIDHGRLAIRRRIAAACDEKGCAAAVVFESLRAQRVGDEPTARELADAAQRIASDPLP